MGRPTISHRWKRGSRHWEPMPRRYRPFHALHLHSAPNRVRLMGRVNVDRSSRKLKSRLHSHFNTQPRQLTLSIRVLSKLVNHYISLYHYCTFFTPSSTPTIPEPLMIT